MAGDGNVYSDHIQVTPRERNLHMLGVMKNFFHDHAPQLHGERLAWSVAFVADAKLPYLELANAVLTLSYDRQRTTTRRAHRQEIHYLQALLKGMVAQYLGLRLRVSPAARKLAMSKTIQRFFRDYRLEDLHCTWALKHENNAHHDRFSSLPQVQWDPVKRTVDVFCKLDDYIDADFHDFALQRLRSALLAGVRGSLILATYSPAQSAALLDAMSATRLSGNFKMRNTWQELDKIYPAQSERQKAELLFCAMHEPIDQPALLHENLYIAKGLWSETVKRQERLLTIEDVQRLVQDKAARIQQKRVRPDFTLRFLSINDYSEEAYAEIVDRNDISFPETRTGSSIGPIVKKATHIEQKLPNGSIMVHRLEDFEHFPPSLNSDDHFDISYTNNKATLRPARSVYLESLNALEKDLVNLYSDQNARCTWSAYKPKVWYTGKISAVSKLHFFLQTSDSPLSGIVCLKEHFTSPPKRASEQQVGLRYSDYAHGNIGITPFQKKSGQYTSHGKFGKSLGDIEDQIKQQLPPGMDIQWAQAGQHYCDGEVIFLNRQFVVQRMSDAHAVVHLRDSLNLRALSKQRGAYIDVAYDAYGKPSAAVRYTQTVNEDTVFASAALGDMQHHFDEKIGECTGTLHAHDKTKVYLREGLDETRMYSKARFSAKDQEKIAQQLSTIPPYCAVTISFDGQTARIGPVKAKTTFPRSPAARQTHMAHQTALSR